MNNTKNSSIKNHNILASGNIGPLKEVPCEQIKHLKAGFTHCFLVKDDNTIQAAVAFNNEHTKLFFDGKYQNKYSGFSSGPIDGNTMYLSCDQNNHFDLIQDNYNYELNFECNLV